MGDVEVPEVPETLLKMVLLTDRRKIALRVRMSRLVRRMGADRLAILAGSILPWLIRYEDVDYDEPLDLAGRTLKAAIIEALLKEDSELSQVFLFEGNRLYFRDVVGSEARRRIALYIREHYRPVIRTKGRKEPG